MAEFAEAIKAGRKEAREQLRTIQEAQRRMIHLEARLKKAWEATQQKAEMVEKSNAASQSLSIEIASLTKRLAQFKLDAG